MDYQNNMTNTNSPEWLQSNAYHDIHIGMVLGIIGCAICWLPLGSIAAIVLGIIGIIKTNRGIRVYASMGAHAPGKRIAARILTICALVGGILMTIYWIAIICLAVWVVNDEGAVKDISNSLYREYRYYR